MTDNPNEHPYDPDEYESLLEDLESDVEEPAPTPEEKPEKQQRIKLPTPTRRHQWGMNPEDRVRVMEACLLLQRRGWKLNFGLMMTMAAIVAGMGLAANSAAVVIGAMLIAPLMTPVLGIAASIAMVIGDALVRSIATVVVATAGVIGIGFLINLVLPGDLLSGEVLARTAPDIKDLVVAVAAGLAGSYATARPDMSSSLPGVAVAVALVPPLAVVGITLQAGELTLAGGALLLYLTNLAGIITLSTIVFVLTGFVPSHQLRTLGPRVLLGILVGVLLMVAVAVPLTITSIRSAERANLRTEVEQAIAQWNDSTSTNTLEEIDTADAFTDITVTVSGSDPISDTRALESKLEEIVGEDITFAAVRSAAERATSDDFNIVEFDETLVFEEVDQWMNAHAEGGDQRIITRSLADNVLALTVESVGDDPLVEDLTARLDARFGDHPLVEMTWLATNDKVANDLRRQSLDWAVGKDVQVTNVLFDGSKVTVDLIGAVMPPVDDLKAQLVLIAGAGTSVDVWFTQRQLVVPTPTPTATPTPTPTATPVPAPPTATPWLRLPADPEG